MSAVIWAAPYAPPPPPVVINPFPGLGMTWTGANGETWDLNDPSTGVCLLTDSVEGLHLPEFEDYTQEFAGLDGQEYDGGIAKARTVEWQILLWSDTSSDEWLAREQTWWSTFKPRGSVGTWAVTDHRGKTRTLGCRLTSDGGFAYAFDPSRAGWHAYSVSLLADDPWWYGEPISRSWYAPDVKMFFGGDDPGGTMKFPPFFLSNAGSFASAAFTNSGDEATWPTWTINGPVDSLTITVNGGTVVMPAVADGNTLVVNMDPSNPTAYDGDTEVSGTVDWSGSRPFPPGETVPVTLDIDYGEGASVSVWAPTKYWRAFG